MKKNDIVTGEVIDINFPNRAVVRCGESNIIVQNALIGQKVEVLITKKKKDRYEGRVLNILEKGHEEIEPLCPHFGDCGGCTYQNLSYEKQLEMKESQVKSIFKWNRIETEEYLGIEASPNIKGYRNKMEFSFGNMEKDGDITLGLHKRGSMYDIVHVNECNIVDPDFNKILEFTLEYAKEKGLSFFHKKTHKGYLRHLVVRKAGNTGEILLNIVTTSQIEHDLKEYVSRVLELELAGVIKTIICSINNKVSDVVQSEKTEVIYGDGYITDEVLGLKFKISAYSFFQTNTKGAEKLYSIVRDFIGDASGKTIYDLYCGTGTIGMTVAGGAKEVIGIELIPEAVKMANENKKLNGIENVKFIEGDVGEIVHTLPDNPDIIIVDPPRDGLHPSAIKKILKFEANEIVYVSCNPKTLAWDLIAFMDEGYKMKKLKLMDMFPNTVHVESVVQLSR